MFRQEGGIEKSDRNMAGGILLIYDSDSLLTPEGAYFKENFLHCQAKKLKNALLDYC